MLNQYVVWCKVLGGVTGTREGPLKHDDGSVWYFDDKEAAQQEADRCASVVSARGPASFSYTVKPHP
jgi:hypothetical protein